MTLFVSKKVKLTTKKNKHPKHIVAKSDLREMHFRKDQSYLSEKEYFFRVSCTSSVGNGR